MRNIKVYGIPNCDTVKKAINWLIQNELPFEFHDYKKEGVQAAALKKWCRAKGWETIFNKRSSTWKTLEKEQQLSINTQADAIALMLEHNSIIKRPVIESEGEILAGFDEKEYIQKLK